MRAPLNLGSCFVAVVMAVATGCDPGGETPEDTSSGAAIPTPLVTMITPTQLTAGAETQIVGQNFCTQDNCRTRITFEGAYQSASGSESVQVEATEIKVINQGTISWYFGPNIPFSQRGEPGTFNGTIRAFNDTLTGQPGGVASDPVSVQIPVGPSIIIDQLGPATGTCTEGSVTDTLENQSMLIQLRASGLMPGTPGAPLMFGYTFFKENFQFEGRFKDTFQTDPQGIIPQSGPVSMIEQVVDGSVSQVGGGGMRNVAVIRESLPTGTAANNSGSALFDFMLSQVPLLNSAERFSITGLKTTPLVDPLADYQSVTVMVSAADSAGNVAQRTIPLKVWAPIEVQEEGQAKVVQAHEPLPVSGCIQGATPPSTVTYTEQSTETRHRGLNTQAIVKPAGSIDFLKILSLEVEGELGIRFDEEATSATLQGQSFQVLVLPGEMAAIYRQTLQLERRVRVRQRDACGRVQDLGYAVVTDWRWAPQVSKRRQTGCAELPPPTASATSAPGYQ